MHVLMVDDHLMFLQGLKNLLTVLAPDLRVDTSGDLPQALQLVQLAAYDLVLLDWHLGGGGSEGDGEASMQRLRDAGCAARIVVLSGETSAPLILRSIELGAAGFIPKSYSSEMMIAALGKVLAGQLFLPAEALRMAASAAGAGAGTDAGHRLNALTPRQRDVYRAAARGLPNKLIARELGIAESTVKTHLTAIFIELGVRNRTEAAYQASRDGVDIG